MVVVKKNKTNTRDACCGELAVAEWAEGQIQITPRALVKRRIDWNMYCNERESVRTQQISLQRNNDRSVSPGAQVRSGNAFDISGECLEMGRNDDRLEWIGIFDKEPELCVVVSRRNDCCTESSDTLKTTSQNNSDRLIKAAAVLAVHIHRHH